MTAQWLLDGRYQVEQAVGSGGMARVWRGRDLRLDRPIAIKKLSGGGLRQAHALERFDREARAIARLSHPNIVSVYDFGTEDDEPYLIMELVEGPTVASRLAAGPMPVADVLAIAAQVCDGLAAAHAAGIVHRDIKPANLILSPSGVVKICDFGVARLLDATGHAELTATGIAMGSPLYMAPEQVNHHPVGPRTDLYALGCAMYAMLAGDPPFHGGAPVGILHRHVNETPPPLRERNPGVPPEVADLVAELLAKAPDDRPADAAATRARIVAAAADPAATTSASTIRQSVVPVGPASASVGSDEQGAVRTALAAPPAIALPTGEPPSDPSSPTTRRRWLVAAVAGATLVAATVAALVAMNPSGPQDVADRPTGGAVAPTAAGTSPAPVAVPSAAPPTAGPSTVASPTGTASSPPSATPTTFPPPAPVPPPPPADPFDALRQAIQQQTASGDLAADAVRDLNHKVDDLEKSSAEGRPDDQAKKLKALRDKLASLKREHKLTETGYDTLSGAVDRVAATLG